MIQDVNGMDWKGEQRIGDDRAWPLFSVNATYEQDLPTDKYKPSEWQTEGMPEGRIKSSSSWGSRGFREWPSQKALEEWARKLWGVALEKPRTEFSRIINPANLVLVINFEGWSVWWLTWFQHETFDVGLDDAAVLASFQRHCDREIQRAWEAGEEPCLMGAEDRWRWTGSEPSGDPDSNSPPPCRCEFCKRDGLVRIGH
jgi:hypothetical protein